MMNNRTLVVIDMQNDITKKIISTITLNNNASYMGSEKLFK